MILREAKQNWLNLWKSTVILKDLCSFSAGVWVAKEIEVWYDIDHYSFILYGLNGSINLQQTQWDVTLLLISYLW